MEKLGINLQLILFQTINFFVLMFILKKFLYKPMISMFDKRRKEVEETEQLRKELDTEKASLNDEKKKVLSEARHEADGVLTEVHKQADEIKRKIEKDAREQAQQIVTRAEEQNETLERRIREEMTEDVKKVAMIAAEKVLSNTMTEEQRTKILEQAAKEFAQS